MPFKFVQVTARNLAEAEAELNRALSQVKVVALGREFVSAGADSHFWLWVEYVGEAPPSVRERPAGPSSNGSDQGAGNGDRADYSKLLSREDYGSYLKLHALRRTVAMRDRLVNHHVFTNEQMAEFVRRRARTASAMEKVRGVGRGRMEKHGAEFLEVLTKEWGPFDEAGREPVCGSDVVGEPATGVLPGVAEEAPPF